MSERTCGCESHRPHLLPSWRNQQTHQAQNLAPLHRGMWVQIPPTASSSEELQHGPLAQTAKTRLAHNRTPCYHTYMGRDQFSKTRDEVEAAVLANITMSATLRTLGMGVNGGTFDTLKRRLRSWGISTEHWLGCGHNKGQPNPSRALKRPLAALLIRGSRVARGALKRRLIAEGVLRNTCATCGLDPVWEQKPLTLVLDHINGVNDDYRLKNLRLLCPNCNSQTDTFCGRNVKAKRPKRECLDCHTVIGHRSERCKTCAPKATQHKEKIKWPSDKTLLMMIRHSNVNKVALKLGAAYNSVKKRFLKIRRRGETAATPVLKTGASA